MARQRLCETFAVVQHVVHQAGFRAVARGSAVSGTACPWSDLDVHAALTRTDGAHEWRTLHVRPRGFVVLVRDTQVDIMVKWAPSGTCFLHWYDRAGGLRVEDDACELPAPPSLPLDVRTQAILAVKCHVHTHRPGVRSCHIEQVARDLPSTMELQEAVRWLWAAVVRSSLTPTTALDADYPHGPPYAGHDDFLEDEVAVFPPQLNQPCGTTAH